MDVRCINTKHLYSIGGLVVECDFRYNVMQQRSEQFIATGSDKITDLYISGMNSEIILLNKERKKIFNIRSV